MCVCNVDATCNGMAGQTCAAVGATTYTQCSTDGQGCVTATTGQACTAPNTCNTPVGTIIPTATGVACGCPVPIAAPTDTTKLVDTGCSPLGSTKASPGDDAVLVCAATGGSASCNTWQRQTNCALQNLTAATVGGNAVCVCKPQTRWAADYAAAPVAQQASLQKPSQYYVDPDPPMATFMNGAPTGAIQPPACRFPSLTQALAKTGRTEVVAFHESSSNVHFLSAGPNAEVFPMNVDNTVRLYTADVGSFNPAHYTLDVTPPGSGTTAIFVGSSSSIEGLTIDASAQAAAVVQTIVSTPPSSTTAIAGILLNQDVIRAQGGQTAILVTGQSTAALTQVTVGGTGTTFGAPTTTGGPLVGLQVNRSAGTAAAVTASNLLVSSGSINATGVRVGPDAGSTATLSTSTLTLPGAGSIGIDLRAGTLTSTSTTMVINGTGIAMTTGTATVNGAAITANGMGVNILAGTATFGTTNIGFNPVQATDYGYRILGGTVSIGGGQVTGGATAGYGVWASGGTTTLTSVGIVGGSAWNGVWVGEATAGESTALTTVATVTITGTATAKSVINNNTAAATAVTGVGIIVGTGNEPANSIALPRLTITDNTTVSGYLDGLDVLNGHVVSTGTGATISGSRRDGVLVKSNVNIAGTNPNDPLSTVSLTDTTISGNARLGVLVSDVAPVALSNVTVTNNGTTGMLGGGIDVQQSTASTVTGGSFKLAGSKVTNNKGCGVAMTGGFSAVGPTLASQVQICGVATAGQGGTVTGDISLTTISGNSGVGLYLTEAPNGAADTDVTIVTVQSNTITGNLTVLPASGSEPIAGGVYIAASDVNGAGATVNDVGCGGTAASTACTRVKLAAYHDNVVSCNGRSEIGFGIPQRIDAVSAPTAWDISSLAPVVDVTMACDPVAKPNTITGYAGGGTDLGLAVTTPLIHVTATGVHWKTFNAPAPAPQVDFSADLMTNGDSTTAGNFVFCSAVVATCGGG